MRPDGAPVPATLRFLSFAGVLVAAAGAAIGAEAPVPPPDGPILPGWMPYLLAAATAVALASLATLALLLIRLRAQRRERARAEAAFRSSEALYRETFRQAAVGVAHIGLDGRWLRVNARLCEMLGYSEAEMLQRTVIDTTHPDDRASVRDTARQLVTGEIGSVHFRKRYVTKAGALLWGEVSVSLVRDEATRHSRHGVAVIQDITARMAAEAAVKESDDRFRTFADHVPDVIYIVDAPRRQVEYLSPAYEKVWGEPRHKVMQDIAHWATHLHPADAPALRAVQKRFYGHRDESGPPDPGDVVLIQYRIIRAADGAVRHIRDTSVPILDAAGRIVRVIGIAHDVTDQREAEEALRATQERLVLASAAGRVGVWEVDGRTGISSISPEYCALYGLPEGKSVIDHAEWLSLIHPDDRARMHQRAKASEGGYADYDEEFRIVRADTGEVRWIATRGAAVQARIDPQRVVGVCFDVTERRREQEHQHLLAREVDHRAKNVLAVVQSIVRLTRTDNPKEFAIAVEGRVAALGRAHTLLARDRWTGASLADVVQEELSAYRSGGRVVLRGPSVRLRPEIVQPLSMVLHELATNAAKYGALAVLDGKVEICWDHDSIFCAAPGRVHGLALRWVERGGPAVPSPPARRGFGSTLIDALVRGQLQGEVQQVWSPGGLACLIRLPIGSIVTADGAADPEQAMSYASHLPAAVLRGCRVLVVEDEMLLALDVAETLADLGCHVVGPAGAVDEALRLIGSGAAIDLAVLDVNLKGQVSFPVAERLAARGIPILYVTGYGDLPAGAPAAAIASVLRKPLPDGELGLALAALAARRPRTQVAGRAATVRG